MTKHSLPCPSVSCISTSQQCFSRYDDGGGYCHACGYRETRWFEKRDKGLYENTLVRNRAYPLTYDQYIEMTEDYDKVSIENAIWAQQFDAQLKPAIEWASIRSKNGGICIPIFNRPHGYISTGDISALHIRNNGKWSTEYYTKERDLLFHVYQTGKSLIIVEDIISAIVIADKFFNHDIISLLGVNYEKKLSKLWNHFNCLNGHRYETVNIWLDPDKAGRQAAKGLFKKLLLLGYNVKIIESKRDPKYYNENTDELKIYDHVPEGY